MKISRIRSQILVMPQQDPLANTPEDTSAARPIVIVRLDTDDGIEGIGVTFYGGAITASLKRAVDDLGALTIGEDPLRVEAIIAKLRAAAGGSGPAGMFTLAVSAIDIALWDIRGKALNQPLWKLRGSASRPMRAVHCGATCRSTKSWPRPEG
jgi:L-talarate/galactarate dehydratase